MKTTLRLLPLALLYAAVMFGTGLFLSVVYAQTPTPTPLPPGAHSLPADLGDLMKATGFFGTVTWGISAVIFHFWKLKFGDPNNDVKVIVSVVVGIVVAAASYLIGAGLGYWPLSADGLYETLWRAGQAVLGSKAIFGLTTLFERTQGVRPGN